MKDPKEITLFEWRKKVKKLKGFYNTREELRKDANKKLDVHYHIIEIPTKNCIGIYPIFYIEGGKDDDRLHVMRDVCFYRVNDKEELQQLDSEKLIDALVEKLKGSISIEPILRDALYDTNPDDLMEIFERAVVKKGKVREKGGCYKLSIGGKPGAPFELSLRD